MCGIAGVWNPSSINREIFSKSLHTLNHRGPDNLGSWFSSDKKIGLGHTRLAIIDLEKSGNQPMVSSSGRFVITFNGEIYNYKELKEELLLKNPEIIFQSSSDTEILLFVIEYFGVFEGVQKLRGMFAAGLWDKLEETLHLFRDRAGEKPLYFGHIDSVLYFASELKFFTNLGSDLPLSPEGVNMFFAQGNIPAPYSIFKNIFKVLPAEIISFTNFNKSTRYSYWNMPIATNIDTDISFDRASKKFESLFLQSISEQMVSDVPLGAFLSGGIDSSAVVSAMQELSDQKVQTHSIGFSENDYDESHTAARVARHLKTEHHEFQFSPQDALSVIPKLNQVYCEPFSDSSQIPTFFLCQETKKNVTVALSGDGGDELFGGYNRYILFKRFHKIIFGLHPSFRFSAGKLLTLASQSKNPLLFLDFLATRLLNLQFSSEKLEKIALALSQSSITEMYYVLLQQWNEANWPLNKNASIDIRKIYSKLNDSPINSFLDMRSHDYANYLPNDILVKVDRAAMANSLETRVPFLDTRLIEFAFSLPPNYLIKGNQGKLLIRKFLEKRVPKFILDQPKSGFGVPIEHWLRGPLRPWAESLLFENQDDSNIFNHAVIQQKWTEHMNSTQNWHHHLWTVLMLKSWSKDNNINLVF